MRAQVLASKILRFVSLCFFMKDAKLSETSFFHANNNSFTGPLIIRTFGKRAPRLWLKNITRIEEFSYIRVEEQKPVPERFSLCAYDRL